MKKMINNLVILSFVLLTACDPGVSYHKIIQNESDFDVSVLSVRKGIGIEYFNDNDSIYTLVDTLFVGKKSSIIIDEYEGIGTVYGFACCHNGSETLPMLVYFNDSVKLISDIYKLDNWHFNILKKYRNEGGVCECRLILFNDLLTD
ncbi:hypothetical protein LJC69_05760 [Bacteroidales bacterium OttesenSCG-928-K22]|nr:hypothetical protein [Bacteroidales bacterium OttesenSCG-928-L14]MDL2241114.1 hypothetical protein [Bacteroidales bacterium OttesenSCG-928-K22]